MFLGHKGTALEGTKLVSLVVIVMELKNLDGPSPQSSGTSLSDV